MAGVGLLPMSRKEGTRLIILPQVQEKAMTIKDASKILGISYLHTRKIAKRYREEGASVSSTASAAFPHPGPHLLPPGLDLNTAFCPEEERTVSNDRVIRSHHRLLQILPQSMRPPAKKRLMVGEQLDGVPGPGYPVRGDCSNIASEAVARPGSIFPAHRTCLLPIIPGGNNVSSFPGKVWPCENCIVYWEKRQNARPDPMVR